MAHKYVADAGHYSRCQDQTPDIVTKIVSPATGRRYNELMLTDHVRELFRHFGDGVVFVRRLTPIWLTVT